MELTGGFKLVSGAVLVIGEILEDDSIKGLFGLLILSNCCCTCSEYMLLLSLSGTIIISPLCVFLMIGVLSSFITEFLSPVLRNTSDMDLSSGFAISSEDILTSSSGVKSPVTTRI